MAIFCAIFHKKQASKVILSCCCWQSGIHLHDKSQSPFLSIISLRRNKLKYSQWPIVSTSPAPLPPSSDFPLDPLYRCFNISITGLFSSLPSFESSLTTSHQCVCPVTTAASPPCLPRLFLMPKDFSLLPSVHPTPATS